MVRVNLYFLWNGCRKTSVIYAGANSNIFNSSNLKKHTQDTKFEIVTHH